MIKLGGQKDQTIFWGVWNWGHRTASVSQIGETKKKKQNKTKLTENLPEQKPQSSEEPMPATPRKTQEDTEEPDGGCLIAGSLRSKNWESTTHFLIFLWETFHVFTGAIREKVIPDSTEEEKRPSHRLHSAFPSRESNEDFTMHGADDVGCNYDFLMSRVVTCAAALCENGAGASLAANVLPL